MIGRTHLLMKPISTMAVVVLLCSPAFDRALAWSVDVAPQVSTEDGSTQFQWAGSGRMSKRGGTVSFENYRAKDGTLVRYSVEGCRDAARCRADWLKLVDGADEVFEKGVILDQKDIKIGDRAVVRLGVKWPTEIRVAVLWTDAKQLKMITSCSKQYVVAFEKQLRPQLNFRPVVFREEGK